MFRICLDLTDLAPGCLALRGLGQEDPEPIQLEVEELEYGNDWLDMDSILGPQDGEIEDAPEEAPLPTGDPREEERNHAGPGLPTSTQRANIKKGGGTKGILKPHTGPVRRSPRLKKSCQFVETVSIDQGTTEPINDSPKKCARLFLREGREPDLLTEFDDKYLGGFAG